MEETIRLAKLLGKHLQETEVYAKMQAAQQAADADKDLQDMIGQFNLKRMNMNQIMGSEEEMADGKEKLTALNEEIQKLYGEIMLNANMQLYTEAQGAFGELLQQVNTVINAAANGEDVDHVDFTEHACSGDCSACGGCH